MDKLDTQAATAVRVSGPEDPGCAWHQIDWRQAEHEVRRLRGRIFTASRAGDLPRVRRLQRLMLRSRSNALVSVRRVTERNAGRLTAGVDGEVVVTPEAKLALADRIAHGRDRTAVLPVRRVYIPKPGGKQRPLGIPAILDRAHQARIVAALEPEWEAAFEPRSYGFRPGRGCHDAIQSIYQVIKGKAPARLWVLDADLAGAFDRISHDHILNQIGGFPEKGMIAAWLRSGVVESGRLHRTEEGTPQGGVVSPELLNIALHGMEKAAGVRYLSSGSIRVDSPALVRYADDFVVLCHTRQDTMRIKARLATWLAPRGLAFNEDKTRVVTLAEGFDFLGFNVRRYGQKPLIRPSKAAIRRIREQVSSRPFKKLDQHLWALTYRWALLSHRNKSRPWVFARYFDTFNRSRQDRWVFGDRASGAYLHRFAWTGIVRHQNVRHRASPDDPALRDYWAQRRRKTPLPINHTRRRLLEAQHGRCAICNATLHTAADRPELPHQWEHWLAANHAAITTITTPNAGTTDETEHRLIHTGCAHRQPPAPANRTRLSRMR